MGEHDPALVEKAAITVLHLLDDMAAQQREETTDGR